eukprot:3778310-Amphidinium_carterae.2
MEDLKRMRDALKENLITGRRQRLQIWYPERVPAVPAPKAPPAGTQPPSQSTTFALNAMTLQELREKVRQEEHNIEQNKGGAYVAAPIPNLQKYRDQIEELETRAQDEADRRNRLQAEERPQQQEAERVAREAAELESQAANTDVPQGQVSQVEVREAPHIGAVQSIHSSTEESTSSTGGETLRGDSADYWYNIVDCMMDYFFDENEITTQVSLHEGVLYWMMLDEIKSLEERWRSGNDPETTRDYDIYTAEQEQLNIMLRQDYESANGRIEESEEVQDSIRSEGQQRSIRTIIYQYAKDLRVRKGEWRDRDKETGGREEERRSLQGEVQSLQTRLSTRTSRSRGRQKKKRREQGVLDSSAAAAAASAEQRPEKQTTPPKPTRPVPLQQQDRVPAAPEGRVPLAISPRLRLEPKNFKNEKTQKEDSYYEKKIFEELKQRSYITGHPTSQYKTSSNEIKRVFDGFDKHDYLEEKKNKIREVQQRGAEEAEVEGCTNTTKLLQRLLTMSMHYAPDFFKTMTTQKRDDLRGLNWDEEQVQLREQELRDTKLLELYAIIPQKAVDMWITCGRTPASYIVEPTDPRHGY